MRATVLGSESDEEKRVVIIAERKGSGHLKC
jgi:hypothetical protein